MGSGQMGSGQMSAQRSGQSGMGSMLARGGSILAASLLFLLGVYHFFSGIAGFARDNFYTVGTNYPYDLSSTGWGWIHVLGGVLLAITGLSLFSRNATWARPVAIVLLVYSLVANFFFLAFFPLWALPMIALAIFAIWAIARDGSEDRQREAMQAMMGERSRYGSPQHGQAGLGGQQQAGAQQRQQQREQAGTGAYVSPGASGTGSAYGAGQGGEQSGQRWPENVGGRDESAGRHWAPSDVKESGSRLGEKAQERAQSGGRGGGQAGQAGRNAAEEAAQRAQQGRR